jgi:PAS domain S-box-containing protein
MSAPLRVLVIDDSESDALLIVRELKRGGFAPSWERVDTAEAMRSVLARKEFDVILSDHGMPRFDAHAALAIAKELCLDVPFIIVSGNIGETVVAAAMRSGAHDYVMKGEIQRLVPAVERTLREAAERGELRRAEAALRQSEERFALAMEGSRDGLWDWSFATNEAYYSERFKEILACDRDVLGPTIESFVSLLHEEDRDMVRSALKGHLERREPYDVEFRRVTDAGELRWLGSRGQALWDASGRATRMAGSLSDITARKQADAVLREKLAIIENQQEAIRKLSTPIIEVWEGVLTMPVFGAIDEHRATQMIEVLLNAVVSARCRYAIIDVTGVDQVDGRTGEHIVRLVRAVELIGARGIVVGIRAEVAQAMVSLGLDLSTIVTLRNLRGALHYCIRRMPSGLRSGSGRR